MIAHLPMYDVPANRAAHRRLWQALQDQLPDAPNFSPPSADLMDDWLSPESLPVPDLRPALSRGVARPGAADWHARQSQSKLPARLLLLGAPGPSGRCSRPCGQ